MSLDEVISEKELEEGLVDSLSALCWFGELDDKEQRLYNCLRYYATKPEIVGIEEIKRELKEPIINYLLQEQGRAAEKKLEDIRKKLEGIPAKISTYTFLSIIGIIFVPNEFSNYYLGAWVLGNLGKYIYFNKQSRACLKIQDELKEAIKKKEAKYEEIHLEKFEDLFNPIFRSAWPKREFWEDLRGGKITT